MLQGVLIWSALFSVLQNAPQQKGRLILEKCLYETSSGSDGMLRIEHKLRSITTYDKKGQMIKDVIFSDYASCGTYSELYNRPKTSFSFWYDYQYDSNQLVQLTYRECDSLVYKRQFYSYLFNQLNQLAEKTILTYYFKRHENELEGNNVGDSILESKIITTYRYSTGGNILQETTLKGGYEDEIIYYQYNKRGKLQETKSQQPDVTEIKEYEYEGDHLMRMKISRNELSEIINYTYNAKGLLMLEVMKIPNEKDITYKYFYNEEDRLIRIEKFNGYDLNIDEYEYTYYD